MFTGQTSSHSSQCSLSFYHLRGTSVISLMLIPGNMWHDKLGSSSELWSCLRCERHHMKAGGLPPLSQLATSGLLSHKQLCPRWTVCETQQGPRSLTTDCHSPWPWHGGTLGHVNDYRGPCMNWSLTHTRTQTHTHWCLLNCSALFSSC